MWRESVEDFMSRLEPVAYDSNDEVVKSNTLHFSQNKIKSAGQKGFWEKQNNSGKSQCDRNAGSGI